MKLILTIFSVFVLHLHSIAQREVFKKTEELGKFGTVELKRSTTRDTIYHIIFKNAEFKTIDDISFTTVSKIGISNMIAALDTLLSDKSAVVRFDGGMQLHWNESDKVILTDKNNRFTRIKMKDATQLMNRLKEEFSSK